MKDIRLSSLEEELRRLKSSAFHEIKNKNQTNDFEKSKKSLESYQIKQGLIVKSISKTYDKRKVVNKVSLELQ